MMDSFLEQTEPVLRVCLKQKIKGKPERWKGRWVFFTHKSFQAHLPFQRILF